jgi:hypothetical protein
MIATQNPIKYTTQQLSLLLYKILRLEKNLIRDIFLVKL